MGVDSHELRSAQSEEPVLRAAQPACNQLAMSLGSRQDRGYVNTVKASLLLMAAAAAALGAGCGKPPESQAPPLAAATPATNTSQASANSPDAPVAVPGNPSGNAVAVAPAEPNLQQLTMVLHRWIGKNQRLPRNFEEFAASTTTQIPPAPAGKKYGIDSSWKVVLVNR